MELNRDTIIKDLDCFHQRILSTELASKVYASEILAVIDAIALIKELTGETERLKEAMNNAHKEGRAEAIKDIHDKFAIHFGTYTYDDSVKDFSKGTNTTDICADNGKEVMFESYAALAPADGLVQYGTAGHVIMCTEVNVVRSTSGAIDPEKSYILYIDQHSGWKDDKQTNGDPFQRQGGVNSKMTFKRLFNAAYLPFTLPELVGADPVEKSETSFSFTEGDTITIEQLKAAKVTSNYAISDSYVIFLDKDGNQVDYKVVRARRASVKSMALENAIFSTSVAKYATEDYSIRVEVQISTGERVTVYEGKLTK